MVNSVASENGYIDTGNLDPYIQEHESVLSCIAGLAVVFASSSAEVVQKIPSMALKIGRNVIHIIDGSRHKI